MHQPYYKDDISNTTLMPWVFLHAIKDYYEMPWYQEKFPNIKATYNLVPSLLKQLEGYINRDSNDKFLNTLAKDVYSLNLEEEQLLEEYLFLPTEQMIKPLSRYNEFNLKFKANENSLSCFSKEELIELQVLFLLSWCGNYLRENSSFIKELLLQERFYNQEQKNQLFEELYSFLEQIVPFYKKLQDSGQIDISTTPYYHPILPLLLDRTSAKEAKPSVLLPSSSASYEEFASYQVEDAVEYFQELFENRPKGFWPSEGSVSSKTISLLAQNGVKWACTDEEILYKSLNNNDKSVIYKPYYLETDNGNVNLFFRDKYLSDLIGFDYSKKAASEAAYDFISHLKSIYLNSDESLLVPVILDGENAWEFYPNNAMAFFEELYRLLDEQTWCETLLFKDIDEIKELKKQKLPKIASGSWINGNFDIWIGCEEKNRAWELLDLTKNSFDKLKESLDDETFNRAKKEFMIALGSDWFWWYGDDHFTELNHHFDEQFRAHLKNVFEIIGEDVPKIIYTPIVKKDSSKSANKVPKDFIKPLVDGNMSNFFEWLNCGFIDIQKEFSTMDSSNSLVQKIYYGKDKKSHLYIYLAGAKIKNLDEDLELRVNIDDKIFIFDISKQKKSLEQNGTYFDMAVDSGIELKVYDLRSIKVKFSFEIYKKDQRVQKYPLYDETILDFENLSLKSWYI